MYLMSPISFHLPHRKHYDILSVIISVVVCLLLRALRIFTFFFALLITHRYAFAGRYHCFEYCYVDRHTTTSTTKARCHQGYLFSVCLCQFAVLLC